MQEQLQETYRSGQMRGIQKDSRYTVLVHNLSLFESDDVQAKMEQDRLVLTQGDGRGASVSGTLADWSYCVAQVEPKSWLESLFFRSVVKRERMGIRLSLPFFCERVIWT